MRNGRCDASTPHKKPGQAAAISSLAHLHAKPVSACSIAAVKRGTYWPFAFKYCPTSVGPRGGLLPSAAKRP